MPNTDLIKFLAGTFCDAPTRVICSNIIFLIAGYDTRNFNMVNQNTLNCFYKNDFEYQAYYLPQILLFFNCILYSSLF